MYQDRKSEVKERLNVIKVEYDRIENRLKEICDHEGTIQLEKLSEEIYGELWGVRCLCCGHFYTSKEKPDIEGISKIRELEGERGELISRRSELSSEHTELSIELRYSLCDHKGQWKPLMIGDEPHEWIVKCDYCGDLAREDQIMSE